MGRTSSLDPDERVVVLASGSDRAASDLVERWPGKRALLVTPADLSRSGWRHQAGEASSSIYVANGERHDVCAVAAVLTRLSFVSEYELGYIVAEDRAYVAAEMQAFLLAWLSDLECPVLNRPTPGCLSGPLLRREQWILLAASLGIPVRPVLRRAVLGAPWPAPPVAPTAVAVSVVGGRLVGPAIATLGERSGRLARAAGADLFTAWFESGNPGAALVAAEAAVDLGREDVASLVVAHVESLR